MKLIPKFLHWLETTNRVSPTAVQGVMAVLVGLGAGGSVLLFRQLFHFIHSLLYEETAARLPMAWLVFLFPVVGGLLVGLMRQFVLAEERHHGVAGIMEAVALAGGRLRYQRIPLKALAAAISIGSGASVGPEDPSVQIGSGFGSMLGQVARLSSERTRVLVATGAAAGIAAAFNAPIAGVFFATEIILGEFATASFGMIVLGSVISSVLTRAFIGPTPAFPIPGYVFQGALELPFYFGLGLLAAPVALAYVRTIYFSHQVLHRVPRWLAPIGVGLLVGLIGLAFPEILSDSYEATGDILLGKMTLIPAILLFLMALKIILTALSLGAGFVGGVFAPSLFLGAALGGAYGGLMSLWFPQLGLQPSAFALVGMAAVLAGTVRAPVTAIMLLFELTNDYRIILPVMFAVVVCVFVAEALLPHSVYTLSLANKGIRLRQGRDVDLMESLLVSEVMTQPTVTLSGSLPVRTASAIFSQTRSHGLPVLDSTGALCGVLTIQDIEQAIEKDPEALGNAIQQYCTRELLVAYPDETVQQALRRMSARDIGRLPVVERGDSQHLVGWLRRSDVIRAYELALARRATESHRAEQIALDAISGAQVLELEVMPRSVVQGKMVAEVAWPKDCIVASIRRGRRLIIPHGETRLQVGDQLAVVVEEDDAENVRALVRGA